MQTRLASDSPDLFLRKTGFDSRRKRIILRLSYQNHAGAPSGNRAQAKILTRASPWGTRAEGVGGAEAGPERLQTEACSERSLTGDNPGDVLVGDHDHHHN